MTMIGALPENRMEEKVGDNQEIGSWWQDLT